MRRLRHRLLQRLVALLLVAGVAAGAVPVVQAETGARAERGLDRAALDAARAAAAQAPTRDAAIDRFVAVYVHASGEAGVGQQLYDALRGDALSGVPPAPQPVAVAAPVAAPPTAAGSVGMLPRLATAPRLAETVVEAPATVVADVRVPQIGTAPARAP